jgi:hypothetical protein
MAGFELLAALGRQRDEFDDLDGEETREGIPIALWRSLR